MELLDTIPVYDNPMWLVVVWIISGVLLFALLITKHEDDSFVPGIIAIISLLVVIASSVLLATKTFSYHDHDEYVVRLTDMSATDFFKDYEIVKTYEYSDAWRVKKKDGVK